MDAPPRRVGPVRERRARSTTSTSPAKCDAGPASAPPDASRPTPRRHGHDHLRARPSSPGAAQADPDARWSCCCTAAGRTRHDIIALADHLPDHPAYAAVRAPIAEGGGYAWFANRGIGRPVAESLAETMAWFRTWLDDVAPAGPAGRARRVQRRRRLRRRAHPRRPDPLRRRRHPLRHTARSTPACPPPPADSTGCRCSSPTATPTPSSPATCSTAPGATCTTAAAPPRGVRDPGGHGISAGVLATLNDWLGAVLAPDGTPA